MAKYAKIMAEVALYGKDTLDVLIERQWMEQPPLALDRQKLQQG